MATLIAYLIVGGALTFIGGLIGLGLGGCPGAGFGVLITASFVVLTALFERERT